MCVAQVMAFFVTARVTQFYCELFQAMGIPVLEMHSRKSQPQRTRAAEQFRNSQRCIMFSSDVRACWMLRAMLLVNSRGASL